MLLKVELARQERASPPASQQPSSASSGPKKSSLLAVARTDTGAVNHILATSLSLSKCAMYRTWPTLIVTVRPEIYFGMRSHVRTCTSIYGHCDMGKRAYINNVICNTPTNRIYACYSAIHIRTYISYIDTRFAVRLVGILSILLNWTAIWTTRFGLHYQTDVLSNVVIYWSNASSVIYL